MTKIDWSPPLVACVIMAIVYVGLTLLLIAGLLADIFQDKNRNPPTP